MPLYSYSCKCGHTCEEFRAVAYRDDGPVCSCGIKMEHDVCADHRREQRPGYWTDLLSDAMGVMPDQVAEHRKMYPDIPMTDDGRVIVRSHQEHRRIMKRLGFVDRAGFH